MLIVGHFYPQKDHVDIHTEQVDITPWSLGTAAASLICLASVSMYIFLAHGVPGWLDDAILYRCSRCSWLCILVNYERTDACF